MNKPIVKRIIKQTLFLFKWIGEFLEIMWFLGFSYIWKILEFEIFVNVIATNVIAQSPLDCNEQYCYGNISKTRHFTIIFINLEK